MSRIKGKNTKPELLIRSALHSAGFRFRLHRKDLPGKPDIVLRKYKTVIFFNGCFWHGHHCKFGTLPKSNVRFWENKINRTRERDVENDLELEKLGWRVIRIWKCSLKVDLEATLSFLLEKKDGQQSIVSNR